MISSSCSVIVAAIFDKDINCSGVKKADADGFFRYFFWQNWASSTSKNKLKKVNLIGESFPCHSLKNNCFEHFCKLANFLALP